MSEMENNSPHQKLEQSLKAHCEKIKGNKHPLYDEIWADYADRNGITYTEGDANSYRSYIDSYHQWYQAKGENQNNNSNNSNNQNSSSEQQGNSGQNNEGQTEENNNQSNQSSNSKQSENTQTDTFSNNEQNSEDTSFKRFGKTLNKTDPHEAFLLNELDEMNTICQSDKILSSLISNDLNVSIQVIHDDKRQAPIYDDMSKSLIYHQKIVDNQITNKGKNGISYYTQSSLFHELVHAEQMKSGLKPAQMKMSGDKPCFVIENAYDLMGVEAECKMLNAMYHIKAWQKDGKSLDEIKQHCLTLQKEGKEFEHGNTIPEYIDVMKQAQQQGKTNDEAHLAAGKQVILSLMSGKYPEWKDMYFNQIKTNAARAKTIGSFPEPILTPSQKLLSRLESNYKISKDELQNCQMTTQLKKHKSGNHYDKMMALRGITSSNNEISRPNRPQKINNLAVLKALKDIEHNH